MNSMSKNKKAPERDLSVFITGQWIIFFDYTVVGNDEKPIRFFYQQWYNTTERPRFSSKKFCCFNDIIECNRILDKIMKYISQFGLMVPDHDHHCFKHLESTEIHLKVGKLQDS